MLKAITAVWRFFKLTHSGSDEGSAKRLYGGLIIIATLVIVYFVALQLVPVNVWTEIESTLQYIFTIGATLLGLNIAVDLTKIATSKKGEKNGKDETKKSEPGQPGQPGNL